MTDTQQREKQRILNDTAMLTVEAFQKFFNEESTASLDFFATNSVVLDDNVRSALVTELQRVFNHLRDVSRELTHRAMYAA